MKPPISVPISALSAVSRRTLMEACLEAAQTSRSVSSRLDRDSARAAGVALSPLASATVLCSQRAALAPHLPA